MPPLTATAPSAPSVTIAVATSRASATAASSGSFWPVTSAASPAFRISVPAAPISASGRPAHWCACTVSQVAYMRGASGWATMPSTSPTTARGASRPTSAGQQRSRVSRLHEGALARARERHADGRAHARRADPVDACAGQPGRQQRAEVVLAHRRDERAAQAEPRARDGDVAGATGSDLGARRVGELAVHRQGLEAVEDDVDAGRADARHVMGRSDAQRATSVARSSRMTVTRI